MEQIPVMIDGRQLGTAQFRREGAYMVCYGQVSYVGEMLKLWVYGNGEPAYLGVLIPDGQGGSTLRRKFSLSDYARLPRPMKYCGTEQENQIRNSETSEQQDFIWYAVGDGTLVREDGTHRYIAFPADEVRLPRGASFLLREIEGQQYMVFLA